MSSHRWDALAGRPPRTIEVAGEHVGRGSLVRLHPRPHGDVLDTALDGRTAVVEALHQDVEGVVQLAVVLDDDPGRDLGIVRQPAHRFFFAADEVEPLGGASLSPGAPSVLVAGIGNVLLGDDGFGVEAVRLLAQRELPAGVRAADFGIRGMDLAFELQEDYDAAVLLDAVPRGEPPGTLFVIEHDPRDEGARERSLDPHGMDPVRVLALARVLGTVPPRIVVVGCEPARVVAPDDERIVMELSAPVRAAAAASVALVETLLAELLAGADADDTTGEEARP